MLAIKSNNREAWNIERGVYDVLVDNNVVLKDFNFRTGAVYTINVYENNLGEFVSKNILLN